MMVANLKRLFSPSVVQNLGALFTLQMGTYLIPLLLTPYLVRTLGLEAYGTWMFASAFLIFARVCVSYGFDLTVTRQVAVSDKDDCNHHLELLTDVVTARVFILVLSLGALLLLSMAVTRFENIRLLILAGSLILLGEAIFPAWLFQGMERMGTITQLRLSAKLLNLLLVIIFVKEPDDLLFVPLLEGGTTLLSSLVGLWLAVRRFNIRATKPRLDRIRVQLSESGPIFLANLSVQFYTTLSLIVLGFILGPVSVAAYSIAEKIYSALRGLLGPFVQATFPAFSRMYEGSREEFQVTYHTVVRSLTILLTLIGLALWLSSDLLVILIAGEPNADAVTALRVLAVAFPFALGSFLAPMLVVRRGNVALMMVTISGGVIGLLSAVPLAIAFGAPGAAGVLLVVQLYNTIVLLNINKSKFLKET